MATKRAIVLGAGGHAASSFEIGVLAGLASRNLDVDGADAFIGTCAGARVAVELASGKPIADLFRAQLEATDSGDMPSADEIAHWREAIAKLSQRGSTTERLRRVGAFALSTAAPQRPRPLLAQFREREWPERRVLVVAVEIETGLRRVFDRESGVSPGDAIAASGAVAGSWPPVAIDGNHYINGGFYSTDNADLAAGHQRVLVIALRPSVPSLAVVSLDTALDRVRNSGARVEVIQPDDAAQAVLARVGGNVLDPAIRAPMAHAAYAQGRRLADRVASLWR